LNGKKAIFNTKIVSEMKYNGEIVTIIDFIKGKDIYCDRYCVKFSDGTINNNVMSCELDFDLKLKNKEIRNYTEKVEKKKNFQKDR